MELRAIRSFYDSREGLVTLDDDVLSIVSQVRELYGDHIRICWEPTTEWYVISEMCSDGTERLVFTVAELDARVIERLQRADQQSRGFVDAYNAAEREQDRLQSEKENEYRGVVREVGEHLLYALKREGKAPRLPLSKSMYLPASVEKKMERAR